MYEQVHYEVNLAASKENSSEFCDKTHMSQEAAVGIVTRLQAGWSEI